MRRLLAGIMAEVHVLGRESITRESGDDRQRFNKDLALQSDSIEVRESITRAICIEMAETFRRSDVQSTVRGVAAELLDRLQLDDDDVRRIARQIGLETRLPLRTVV